MTLTERLADIAAQVKEGRTPKATVRELLGWYHASRRGYWIVQGIRNALKEAGLRTEPDFESVYIDADVAFVPAETPAHPAAPAQEPEAAPPAAPVPEPAGTPGALAYADPTYRISKLASANRKPVVVPPDAPIARAATLMLTNASRSCL